MHMGMWLFLFFVAFIFFFLLQIVRDQEVDVAVISKQYASMISGFWLGDETSTAAIWITYDKGARHRRSGKGDCFTWVQFDEITLMSYYLILMMTWGPRN